MAETLRSLQLKVAKQARELNELRETNRVLRNHIEQHAQVHQQQSALDVQIGGDHYKKLAIQPVEYILANELPFIEGNVVKYITRWRDKGGIKDLQKIQHFTQLLIEDTQAKQEVENTVNIQHLEPSADAPLGKMMEQTAQKRR